MSTAVAYDPSKFLLERAAQVSAKLGELILGESRLGATSSEWVTVPMATFSYAEDYAPDENGTLLYQSETASVSLSYWHQPAEAPLYSADRIRASYDGKTLFLGTIDTTRFTYATDPEAADHGATHRVDFTATAVGTYAAALAKRVCWLTPPGQPEPLAIDWIRNWVTVDGWD